MAAAAAAAAAASGTGPPCRRGMHHQKRTCCFVIGRGFGRRRSGGWGGRHAHVRGVRSKKQWHLRRRRGVGGGRQLLGSGSGSRSGIVFILLSFFGRGWVMLGWHTFFDGGTLPSGGRNAGWRGIGCVLLFAALMAGGGASSGRHSFFIRQTLV